MGNLTWLSGKSAIVTGAGSGLGREIALLFAAHGAQVLCADINADTAAATAAEAGLPGAACRVDVTEQAQTEAMAAEALRRFGRIDVLLQGAGITGAGRAHETEREFWDKVIAVDLTGTWLANRAVLPAMLAQRSGSIINISSLAGIRGVPSLAAYAAAKAGVVGLTQQMAVDYAPHNIRVNALCPGTVVTPLVIETFTSRGEYDPANPEASLRAKAAHFPIGRFGQPSEVAHLALYLASDHAGFMTGAIIPIDGGVSAAAWKSAQA